jgi:hypothetical protein
MPSLHTPFLNRRDAIFRVRFSNKCQHYAILWGYQRAMPIGSIVPKREGLKPSPTPENPFFVGEGL